MSRIHDTNVPQENKPEYVPGTEILDSGKRKEFSSGAVRDLEEGKGSFDLLPCRTIQSLAQCATYNRFRVLDVQSFSQYALANMTMDALMDFGQDASITTFKKATILGLCIFIGDGNKPYPESWKELFVPQKGHKVPSFAEIPYEGLRRVAEHFRKGALKYSSRNWEKGIHLSRFRSSAMRHLMQFINGMEDEPHLDAAVWNMICYLEMYYMIESGERSVEFIGDEYVLSELKDRPPLTPHNLFDE